MNINKRPKEADDYCRGDTPTLPLRESIPSPKQCVGKLTGGDTRANHRFWSEHGVPLMWSAFSKFHLFSPTYISRAQRAFSSNTQFNLLLPKNALYIQFPLQVLSNSEVTFAGIGGLDQKMQEGEYEYMPSILQQANFILF